MTANGNIHTDISICPRCAKRMERILAPGVVHRLADAESFVEVYDHCARCDVYYNVAHITRATFTPLVPHVPFASIHETATWMKRVKDGNSEERVANITAALNKVRANNRPTLVAALRQLGRATLLGWGRPIGEISFQSSIELCPTCRRECGFVGDINCNGTDESLEEYAYCRPCGIVFATMSLIEGCHDHEAHDQETEELMRRYDEVLAGLNEIEYPNLGWKRCEGWPSLSRNRQN